MLSDPMYDAIVVGAGPGGSTAAAMMARDGQRVLLVDKDRFPRDKVCGDAIGGKGLEYLDALGVKEQLRTAEALPTNGITFSSPSGDAVSVRFSSEWDYPGFVCRRHVFDDLVLRAALRAGAEVWQECTVTGLVRTGDVVSGVRVVREDGDEAEVSAPLVVGADGAYSVVARDLGLKQLREKHYMVAIRAYYQGVRGFKAGNYIELHFLDSTLPGYFWIFPLPGGAANVGLGIPSPVLKKSGVRMRDLLDRLVKDPRFAWRFEGSRREGKVRGWGLPLGSRPRTMAGDGWMLVGDAASLIDPFTGEGIGNAVVSAAIAARWSQAARAAGDYSESRLRRYQQEVRSTLRDELRISTILQRMARRSWLLNLVIQKASRSEELADTISCMFDDLGERKKLTSPLFYFRLLAA